MTVPPQRPAAPVPASRRTLQASEQRALLLLGDTMVAGLAVVVALALWTITAGVAMRDAVTMRSAWFLAALAWVLGLAPARTARVALSLGGTVAAVTRLAAALLAAYLALYFYAPRQALPRLLALYVAWEASLLTIAWRLAYLWVATEGGIAQRMLVLGTGESAAAAIAALREARLPSSLVVGVIENDAASRCTQVGGVEVIGRSDALPDIARLERASQVIVAARLLDAGTVERLLRCGENGIRVVPMAVVYEQLLRRVPVEHVGPEWLFTSFAEAVSVRDASGIAKRALDVAGGLAGCLLLAGLLPFVALAIWLESGGPVFYRQERVGRGGRPFVLTKFRTMLADAEADGTPRWARPSDPRVTRLGRWLRRTRLDELPNFPSVLRGDMSLVGPRPERPEFVASLERDVPLYRVRLAVRPGLTGWAQINYPYGDSVRDAVVKLEYDLYYLKHRSLLFDVWIVLRTLGTVLTLKGR